MAGFLFSSHSCLGRTASFRALLGTLQSRRSAESLESLVSPCWASHFCQSPEAGPDKSNQNRLPLHPALRFAQGPFVPSPLQGGRLTRAILGPLSLSPHPCGSLPYATIPLTLLGGWCRLKARAAKSQSNNEKPSGDSGSDPVRRPSRGVAQGDARQDAERVTKGQGRPFVTCPRSGPGAREVWSQARPGCRARFLFGHFLFRASKEKVTRPGGRNQNHHLTR